MLTQAEFADWQNYHNGPFKKFGEWFFGMMGDEREPQEAVEIRSKIWFDSLCRFTVDELKAATVKLATMPREDRPKWFDEHLPALLEILNRPSSRPEQLRKRIVCTICQDTGIVSVTAIPGTALFSAGGLPMPHGQWCAVDCTCERACWYRGSDENVLKRDRYDPKRMMVRAEPDRDRSWRIIEEMRAAGETAKADAWERFLGGGRVPRQALRSA